MKPTNGEAPDLAGSRRFGGQGQEVNGNSAIGVPARKRGVYLSCRADHRHFAVERQAAMLPAAMVLIEGNREQRRAALRELTKRAAAGDAGAALALRTAGVTGGKRR